MQFRSIFAGLALATLAACGGESPTAPSGPAVSGTWTMRTVNGTPLPVSLILANGAQIIARSAVLTLTGDRSGTYQEVVTFSFTATPNLTSANSETGTWTVAGNIISFATSTGDHYTGTVTGNTLTEVVGGLAQVYSR